MFGIWKGQAFWEIRDYTNVYREACPQARAENKESKGEERTRVRRESRG